MCRRPYNEGEYFDLRAVVTRNKCTFLSLKLIEKMVRV